MSREPNAILAINSLDRYISANVPAVSYFYANWDINSYEIFPEQDQPTTASYPRVGSVLTAGNLSISGVDLSGAPIVVAEDTTVVIGNALVVGGIYTIVTVGTTNWIGAGASRNIVGVVFQAITTGDGNGTATWISRVQLNKPTLNIQANFARVTQWTYSKGSAQSPISSALYSIYEIKAPYSDQFSITSPGALLYGYIKTITVSQIQLQYDIPTVSRGRNDIIVVYAQGTYNQVTMPYGFYYPDELAAMLQIEIRANTPVRDMVVTFNPKFGFEFSSATINFSFPNPLDLSYFFPDTYLPSVVQNVYRAYKLIGMSKINSTIIGDKSVSTIYPNFLYTPYIDIFSDVLTNYQNVKDTNTSVVKPKGLIARVYLSGTGNIQDTTNTSTLGSRAFVVTADLNSPKIIRWNPGVAIPSIDFQLVDCYGSLIPVGYGFQTEFQMTLLCSEGGD